MNKNIIIIIAAAIILLSIVVAIRPAKTLAGDEAYYHLMAARNHTGDVLSLSEQPLIISQYDHILRYSSRYFENYQFMKIFPIILGAICAILAYLIMNRFSDKNISLYSSLILIISPAFLFIFSTNSAEIISLSLLLLGIFMLIQKNITVRYLSIIPFIFASLSSMFVSILIIVIYFSFFIYSRKKFHFFFSAAIIAAVLAILRHHFIINYWASDLSLTSNLFSDFGGLVGISVFTAIFAFAGLVVSKKRQYAYPIIIFMIIAFLIDFRTIIYSNVLVCGFAGIGLKKIIDKKWKLSNLKQTMNFLMICGLLFSAVAHIDVIKNMNPSKELLSASGWLKENAEKDAVILSHPSNSFIIEYYSERKTIYDSLSFYSDNFDQILNQTQEIYYSRNLEKTEKLLNTLNVHYFLIEPQMTEGEIWTKPNEGLLFLFTNEQKFKTVYDKKDIKIIFHIK